MSQAGNSPDIVNDHSQALQLQSKCDEGAKEALLLQNECKETERKWYHIDLDVLPIKLCYLLVNMKESCYIPYLNLYLPSVGVPLTQAGIITGTRLVGFLCGSPVWGMVADKWKRHSILFTILCVMSALLMLPQPFIAVMLEPASLKSRCGTVNLSLANCSGINVTYDKFQINNESTISSQFWFHLIINIAMMFFDGAIIGLNDSAAMTIIRNSPKKIDFGRQRVFGAVGFGLGTLMTSLFIDAFGKAVPSMSKYSPMFFMYAVAILAYAVCSCFMLRKVPTVDSKCKEKETFLSDLLATLSKFHVIFFLAIAFFAGFDNGLHLGFCLKLLDEMGAPSLLFGLTVAVGASGSILLFPFTTHIIRFFGGSFPAFGVVLFAYMIRFLVYAFATSPYVILTSQVLHCICFALFVASAVLHTNMVSPLSVQSSMFGIMNGLHFGAGFMTANLIGGILYQMYGSRTLFLGGFVLSSVLLGLVLIYVIRNRKKSPSETTDDSTPAEEKQLTV